MEATTRSSLYKVSELRSRLPVASGRQTITTRLSISWVVPDKKSWQKSPLELVGSLNLADILGEAGVVRKATLCASRTPAGYACGPGENFFLFRGGIQPPGAKKARLRGL
jgi:hypothetical protein